MATHFEDLYEDTNLDPNFLADFEHATRDVLTAVQTLADTYHIRKLDVFKALAQETTSFLIESTGQERGQA